MQVTTGDGTVTTVHDLGGDGPPLVVAHATGFLAAPYRALAMALAERFRIWGIDFRAHGHSPRPTSGDLTWARLGGDVLDVVEALGLERPFGFGHSMGGAALVLAELGRPGTFHSLFLYEPAMVPAGAFPEQDSDNWISAAARRRRPRFESRAAARENYAGKPPLQVLTAEALQAYVDEGFVERADGSVELRCRPEDEAEVFLGGGRHDAFARLGDLRLPVTIAKGSVADPGPGMAAESQVAAIPGARLVVAEGLGHLGPLQDPSAVARAVIDALLDR